MVLRRFAAAVVLALLGGAVTACTAAEPDCATAACTRVLFIGNSHTFENDLPRMFGELARAGHHDVGVRMAAAGGATLADHDTSGDTAKALGEQHWNLVVLQEQSQLPADRQTRRQLMYPAARHLVQRIRSIRAEPLLFLTWARRDGWPERGLSGYGPMQDAVTDGYLGLAGEQLVGVAPAGAAWQRLAGTVAGGKLFQSDGMHATPAGTYLAACVFYATVFRQNPSGLAYHADLPATDAAVYQRVAGEVVLRDPGRWNLR